MAVIYTSNKKFDDGWFYVVLFCKYFAASSANEVDENNGKTPKTLLCFPHIIHYVVAALSTTVHYSSVHPRNANRRETFFLSTTTPLQVLYRSIDILSHIHYLV